MGVEITDEEAAGLSAFADYVYEVLARAQGRADSYAARRELIREENERIDEARRGDEGFDQWPLPWQQHWLQRQSAIEAEAAKKEVKDRGIAKNWGQGNSKKSFLNFQKELSKMTKNLQQKIVRALERAPRHHNRVYEKRAMIDGIEIYSCASDADECNRLFLEDLSSKILHKGNETSTPSKRRKTVPFSVFSLSWFNDVHKLKVIPGTFERDRKQFEKHVEPFFSGMNLQEITTSDCKQFNLQFKQKEIPRTWENCDGLLRQIFQHAVDSELIAKHPMAALKRIKSQRENGVPLTHEEERAFLAAIRGTKYELIFLVALYTGLRPCELSSVQIDGDFIVARNRKQKDVKRIVYKKIPITPMLQPYLAKVRAAMPIWKELTRKEHYLSDVFGDYCKGHTLYDLRTTFATRCQECDVSEAVVMVWMGHSARTLLGRVYTKFSDEYLLKEGKKVKY